MKKLKFKNYLGYAIADLANNLGFSIASTYLTIFYLDVIGKSFNTTTAAIWSTIVTVIMVIARVWDGINDPIMGNIVQNHNPKKDNKFKPFILYGGLLLSVIFVIMFIPIPNMSLAIATIFAFVTYIAYGMIYTVVLVPFGSVASVMTRDSKERSKLSIARAIGGGIGGIPAGMLFPLIIYDTETKTINNTKFFICIVVAAVVILICYLIGYFTIDENYPYPKITEKTKIRTSVKNLLHNKPFIIMSLFGMLLIASSMFLNTINVVLFNVFFQKSGMMTFVTIAIYVPMILFIPFTGILIKKFGKKRILIVTSAISTIAALILVVIRTSNPWIYITLMFIESVGYSFATLEIWAIAMDIIDYHEYKTGKREEASCYAIFTFMRKIGQAIAACVPLLLVAVGYDSSKEYDKQLPGVGKGIYTVATIVPLIIFAIMFMLTLLYTLNKKEAETVRKVLKERRLKNDNKVETTNANEEDKNINQLNNVYLNHTLKEYKDKYSKYAYKLIKYTVKEVNDFDKTHNFYIFNNHKYPLNENNILLKGHKWWLINNTYYQIPDSIF